MSVVPACSKVKEVLPSLSLLSLKMTTFHLCEIRPPPQPGISQNFHCLTELNRFPFSSYTKQGKMPIAVPGEISRLLTGLCSMRDAQETM